MIAARHFYNVWAKYHCSAGHLRRASRAAASASPCSARSMILGCCATDEPINGENLARHEPEQWGVLIEPRREPGQLEDSGRQVRDSDRRSLAENLIRTKLHDRTMLLNQ